MDITVSIVMLVYNHERFLAQALDSVLMQKVNFRYELIVGEDCSPDKSREILRSYEEKFGSSLIPLYREKNMGMNRNMNDCLAHCHGKYIAFLEGDDFWTDPYKLQKQVDFLEQHPDYMVVYTAYETVDIHGKTTEVMRQWKDFHEYTLSDFEEYLLPGQTGTMMIAAERQKEEWLKMQRIPAEYYRIPGDRTCLITFLKEGRIAVLPDCMSAYRFYIEEGGTNWTSQNRSENQNWLLKNYMIILALERCANKMGLSCDLFAGRRKHYKYAKDYRQMGLISRKREWGLKLAMGLAEPHKLRLLQSIRLLERISQRGSAR